MKIPEELLRSFEALKAGKVYYGEFARDESSHAAVVISIRDSVVHYFCFTSQELTIKRYARNDPLACVPLTREEADLFFKDSRKQTFIYCGRSNWGRISEQAFLKGLSDGRILLKAELPMPLFERIKAAICSSKTMTKVMLEEMGL